MPEIMEILVCLKDDENDFTTPEQTEAALKRMFGKPNGK